jgi:hypothetical protein
MLFNIVIQILQNLWIPFLILSQLFLSIHLLFFTEIAPTEHSFLLNL